MIYSVSDDEIYDVSRFLINVNNELPEEIRIPKEVPGIVLEKENKKYVNTMIFAEHLKMLCHYAYAYRYITFAETDHISVKPKFVKKEISVPRAVFELEHILYNCDEGDIIPIMIKMMHLEEIKDFFKGSMSELEKKEYEEYSKGEKYV